MTTKSKTKYTEGDRVLIEGEVTQVKLGKGEANIYVMIYNHGLLNFTEDEIYGFAPIDEPDKAGTVVEVGNYAWVLVEDGPYKDRLWESTVKDRAITWQKLLRMGTPKIIWEPPIESE